MSLSRECRNCKHAKRVLWQKYVECDLRTEPDIPLGWFCDRFRPYTEAEPLYHWTPPKDKRGVTLGEVVATLMDRIDALEKEVELLRKKVDSLEWRMVAAYKGMKI